MHRVRPSGASGPRSEVVPGAELRTPEAVSVFLLKMQASCGTRSIDSIRYSARSVHGAHVIEHLPH
eukprot:3309217-Alexandrium_andersonii.AAC.1